MGTDGSETIEKPCINVLREGSGGEGFFVKIDICELFDIEILGNAFGRFLWLKLENRLTGV